MSLSPIKIEPLTESDSPGEEEMTAPPPYLEPGQPEFETSQSEFQTGQPELESGNPELAPIQIDIPPILIPLEITIKQESSTSVRPTV